MLPIDLQILKYYFFEKPIYHYKIKPYIDTAAYQRLYNKLNEYKPEESIKKMKLDDVTYTIFDLETTGLIPEVGHEIISIGAIQVKGLHYCNREKFYRIIKPIRPIPRNITSLTGLDASSIRHGQTFIDVVTDFLDYSKDTILVAHPAKFDVRFLQAMLKRWKLPPIEPLVIDSQEVAKWVLPAMNYQLDPLIRYYNIDFLERHHALNDAIMTAELFENLLTEVKNQNIHSLEKLTYILQSEKKKR